MYQAVLSIAVCSQELFLTKLARSVSPLEHFSYEVRCYDSMTAVPHAAADILIADLPDGGVAALRAGCKPDGALVVCAGAQALSALLPEELEGVWDCWETPLSHSLCALRLNRLLAERKLRKDYWMTCNYLDTAMDNVQDMIWFKDNTGHHLKVNQTFCNIVNKSKEDIAGQLHYYIWDIPEEEYQKGEYVCVETEDEVMEARKTCLFMEKVKTRNGMRQFKTYKSPIFDETGQTIIGTVGTAHDVTDLENISTEMEILLQSLPFAVLVWDEEDIIINFNDRFTQYFGVAKGTVLGHRYSEWERSAPIVERSINSEGYPEATVLLPGAGFKRVLEIHEETIRDVFQHNVGKLCIYRDVTLERALEEKILHNLNTDFLTGLYNRRYFYQYLSECRKGEPLGLLYVDLDRFKEVNDTYGHKAGDEALVCTADILKGYFPENLIARLGGDEFIVAVLGDCNLGRLEEMAGGLIRQMKERFCAVPEFAALSASVGIAWTEDPGLDVDEILHQSDMALYEAKAGERGTYRVYGAEGH